MVVGLEHFENGTVQRWQLLFQALIDEATAKRAG